MPSLCPTVSGTDSFQRAKNTGALIGIVIGGFVIMLAGAMGVYLWRKRKSKEKAAQLSEPKQSNSLMADAPSENAHWAAVGYVPQPENTHLATLSPYPENYHYAAQGQVPSPENVQWAGQRSPGFENAHWATGGHRGPELDNFHAAGGQSPTLGNDHWVSRGPSPSPENVYWVMGRHSPDPREDVRLIAGGNGRYSQEMNAGYDYERRWDGHHGSYLNP